MSAALEVIKAEARKQSTEMIRESVTLLATVENTDERMVRAALIEVFIEREGEVAGDALMDAIGL